MQLTIVFYDKKERHQTYGGNSVDSQLIFKILWLADFPVNLQ